MNSERSASHNCSYNSHIGRDGQDYYFVLGENISYEGCSYEDRFLLTDVLRDRIATLKWEIIEQLPPLKHCEVSKTTYDEYFREITTFNTKYTLTEEDIRMAQFRPKNVTDPEQVFAHLSTLIPNRRNAFLFDKRLRGYH